MLWKLCWPAASVSRYDLSPPCSPELCLSPCKGERRRGIPLRPEEAECPGLCGWWGHPACGLHRPALEPVVVCSTFRLYKLLPRPVLPQPQLLQTVHSFLDLLGMNVITAVLLAEPLRTLNVCSVLSAEAKRGVWLYVYVCMDT